MGSDLLIALAGGAIGAVLAGIGFVAVRLSAVPGEVARHDRRAASLDDDLERWVADDHRKLREELNGIRNKLASEGQLHSGAMLNSRAHAKTGALQRYRDRRSESERALADLVAEEGWPHERWRRLKQLPALKLDAPDRIEPVIDAWRAPVAAVAGPNRGEVHDPTRWTTEHLLKDVRESPLEPDD